MNDIMFTLIPIFVAIIFVVILTSIIVNAVKGGIQWNKNNHSPQLSVEAKVVAKRMAVSHHAHHHGDDMAMHHSAYSSTYYATFEVQSGDRMEFRVPDREYGLLVEGDIGTLSFQGTRYLGFERSR